MMAKRGEDRREKILAVAEQIVLQKGFSGMSIDEVLEGAHITKGGFFYHFDGRDDLARGLIQRYLKADEEVFQQLFVRARTLSEDPLQQMLIFMNLLCEAMENMADVHPGCLVASYTYASQLFDEEIKALVASGTLDWRRIFREQLAKIEETKTPAIEVDLDTLADMLSSVIEGGIILSRILDDKYVLVNQLRQYRNYVRLLYAK
jgi:TetR/AcrR family transcriptional repressor of nem operon